MAPPRRVRRFSAPHVLGEAGRWGPVCPAEATAPEARGGRACVRSQGAAERRAHPPGPGQGGEGAPSASRARGRRPRRGRGLSGGRRAWAAEKHVPAWRRSEGNPPRRGGRFTEAPAPLAGLEQAGPTPQESYKLSVRDFFF